MYDMYSWDQPRSADEHAEKRTAPGTATQEKRSPHRPRTRHTAPAGAARAAVQTALDRRDNGGAPQPRRAR